MTLQEAADAYRDLCIQCVNIQKDYDAFGEETRRRRQEFDEALERSKRDRDAASMELLRISGGSYWDPNARELVHPK